METMNYPWTKADVQLQLDELSKVVEALAALNRKSSTRSMAIVLTHINTAELWLQELRDKSPDVYVP